MNKFNENFDISKLAYELSDKNFSSDEIFEILKNGNDLEKQAVLINLNKINTQDEFEIFISNLTNQSGPIRENVSLKLAELDLNFNINNNLILDALCDVNPNVCRNITEFLKKYNNENLKNELVSRIKILIEDIFKYYSATPKKFRENKEKSKKNHIINKKIFHLYWCLEGLSIIIDDEIDKNIEEILKISSDFYDYTIREKTAQILAKIKNPPDELLQKLKNDDNFYVKNQVYDKI